DPSIGFNYLGRLTPPAAETSDEVWQICPDLTILAAAAAIPLAMAHTVELNAGTVEIDAGPQLYAGWSWAVSALDHAQVKRLNRLWFDALAGICAYVRAGGGGLTPSDIVSARLTQQQIDQLCRRHRIADILPLTPLQQGLLFHASAAHGSNDDVDNVYAVQLDIALSGVVDPHRLRDAVHAVVTRHPNLAARFCAQLGDPVQIIPADPETPWQYVDLNGEPDLEEQIARVCAAERAAVCDLVEQSAFRTVLIRTAADRHRFVLTNHHILLDGWSLPILLREVFANYYEGWLPAAPSYRRFMTWLADRDLEAARAAWAEVLAGFEVPTLVGPPDRLGLGPRDVASFKVSEQTTQAVSELARSCRTTVSTVLQGAFAQLLMSLTGQRDVAFGAVISGRPDEVAGAESMVGLLINTIPVRATIIAETTTADLLAQLHSAHNHTLDHQHLALNEIHRITGQEQLFDTVFVYENYPTDTAALSGIDELVVSEITNRDYYHYPLTIQAVPGRELDLRVQFRTDLFDAAGIEALMQRFERVLVAMTADPARPLSSIELAGAGEHPGPNGRGNGAVLTQPESAAMSTPATPVQQALADIYAQVLGVDRVGFAESFFALGGDSLSAMRVVAAINTALDINLELRTLVDAPSVLSLSKRVGEQPGLAEDGPPILTVSPARDV
ncbi:MAG TPA: condensation domain-containing protein, partial [Mycobacterium sp.]|nr:condensation domain-containing protein [Mycobacterium sp.]